MPEIHFTDWALLVLGLALGWFTGRVTSRRSSRAASDLALASAAPPPLYRIDTLAISLVFDEEGGGTFTRRESGIEPTSDLNEVVLPYAFAVTPQGSLDAPVVRSLSPQIAALWRPTRLESTRMEGTLLLSGKLKAGASAAGYELTQSFRRGFFMSKEETLTAYRDSPMKREYLGVAAYAPTRRLEFRVLFPESHHRLAEGPTAVAFVGETEFENETEAARIRPFLKVESGHALLELENPRRGVRYAISWLAPTREQ